MKLFKNMKNMKMKNMWVCILAFVMILLIIYLITMFMPSVKEGYKLKTNTGPIPQPPPFNVNSANNIIDGLIAKMVLDFNDFISKLYRSGQMTPYNQEMIKNMITDTQKYLDSSIAAIKNMPIKNQTDLDNVKNVITNTDKEIGNRENQILGMPANDPNIPPSYVPPPDVNTPAQFDVQMVRDAVKSETDRRIKQFDDFVNQINENSQFITPTKLNMILDAEKYLMSSICDFKNIPINNDTNLEIFRTRYQDINNTMYIKQNAIMNAQ